MREIERGNTERIEVEVRDRNGNLTDPDEDTGYQITISIEDADGTKDIDGETMTRDEEGVFYYDWTPSSTLSKGEYTIEISATINGSSHVNRDTIELVDVA